MDDGFLWEPSTKKETAYYDKLFGVVDRDKTGTLDGKETVQFLSLSGLSKAQLKVCPQRYMLASIDERSPTVTCRVFPLREICLHDRTVLWSWLPATTKLSQHPST